MTGRPAARKTAGRRRGAVSGVIATALILIAAGSLGVAVSRYITGWAVGGDSVSTALTPAQEAADKLAAEWVFMQVSHTQVVSCDPAMCAALTFYGFPSRDVRVLGPTSPPPLTSAVVIVTQAVLNLFGTSLGSDYAPAILATFGSADASVTVRVIAPHGAAAYQSQLRADLAARKSAGTDLVNIPAITESAKAKDQLLAGQPDARLLLALAFLVSKQLPIDILDFGNIYFGNIGAPADNTIPLRYADLAESDQAAHRASSAYVRALRADLGSALYRPIRIVPVTLGGGQAALRIEFTAPSPPAAVVFGSLRHPADRRLA